MRIWSSTIVSLAVSLLLLALPGVTRAAVLTADTLWQGEVTLSEDVLVPEGVTLRIAPGTVVRVGAAESTKTEPEYLSPLAEVTVRGALRAEGSAAAPISFVAAGQPRESAWAGILIDGGSVTLSHCRVSSAETALHLIDGSLRINDSTLTGNRYGMVIQGEKARLAGTGNSISGNDFGVISFQAAAPAAAAAAVTGNRKNDTLSLKLSPLSLPPRPRVEPAPGGESRSYPDTVLRGDTVWSGRIEVNGTVRIPEGSRLVILPGTVVEFGMHDTNGDGIGENGLLVQGVIIAKGSAAAPIVFRAAGQRRRGSWDAINIMNSDGTWNIIEHCRIEDAYRGLHFHFSRVAVTDCEFSNNYRGAQFQEATVLLRGNSFHDNKSAIQGRDSDVNLKGNRVCGNLQGINLLRCNLVARGNQITGQGRDGVRIREGATVLEENLIDGNRYGVLLSDSYYGSYAKNSISNNAETGLALKNVDNLEITGNFIGGNGLNGITLQEARGRISGNLISDNGDKGIGVLSFSGSIEANNLAGNGRWAIDLDGPADVSAPRNWWGGKSPAAVISDKASDPAKGTVRFPEPAPAPLRFEWPLPVIHSPATWRGEIGIEKAVSVAPGAVLSVAPGARVAFGAGAGLAVTGKILAQGTPEARVTFTAAAAGAARGAWDEIILEHADGSVFSNCVVEKGNWGIHSHFSRLTVSDCTFRDNNGGMRFRSGPIEIRRSLFTDNGIGIRSFRGNVVIEGSTVTRNDTGVFVREKGGGVKLRNNNLFRNNDYNLRLGDFNDEDVDARDNWWGSDNPAAAIYDARNEPGIGTVRFEPFRVREAAPAREVPL
jgi:parallel beta-helix repeat protein